MKRGNEPESDYGMFHGSGDLLWTFCVHVKADKQLIMCLLKENISMGFKGSGHYW